MGVETATKISQLNAAWPPGTDNKSEGDNHLRLIKSVLQSSFDDSGSTIKMTLPIEVPGGKLTGDLDMNGYKILNVLQLLFKDATGLLDMKGSELRNLAGEHLRGYISPGSKLQNTAANTANGIDVLPTIAASDGGLPRLIKLNSPITKLMSAAWAAGNNVGGWLDGPVMPAGATGYCFLLGKSTDLTAVEVGFSASLTPTLPSGWDMKRRIGAHLRDGSSVNRNFVQFGDRFMLNTPVDNRVSAAAFPNALLAVSVPVGINARPIMRTLITVPGSSSATVAISDGDFPNPGLPQVQQVNSGQTDVAIVDMFYSNLAGQIRLQVGIGAGTITSNTVSTLGWWDDRGAR